MLLFLIILVCLLFGFSLAIAKLCSPIPTLALLPKRGHTGSHNSGGRRRTAGCRNCGSVHITGSDLLGIVADRCRRCLSSCGASLLQHTAVSVCLVALQLPACSQHTVAKVTLPTSLSCCERKLLLLVLLSMNAGNVAFQLVNVFETISTHSTVNTEFTCFSHRFFII